MAKPARSPTEEAPLATERSRSAVEPGLRSLASAASGFWDRCSVMGAGVSKLEKALGDQFPEGERYLGLENFGNTCHCNSVLQEQLLEYYANYTNPGDAEENLLTCLADLFAQISLAKKKTGVISPKRFVHRVRKQNESFRSYMHQSLNDIVDTLEKECSTAKDSPETTYPEEVSISNGAINHLANGVQKEPLVTWVHRNFQGILTNETKCLMCEAITAKHETFFDLSIDIEQNSSLTSCLKNFFSTETLNAEDKFFCDKCCSLQEAQKRMKIKKAPLILVIHLKRFKFVEQLSRHKKLSYRVVYPMELKLSSISDNVDCEYSLFAVVVHLGSGPNQGHYLPVLMNAVGGILVGLVTTYAGGVRKGFVIVSALLVTALLQFIFDGKPPSLYCLMALPLVMTSIFIYQKYPYVDRKKKD